MYNYSFSVAWSQADDEYVATSAEFPRLSGMAPTAEEAIAELKAAMQVAIEAYEEDGEEIPTPVLAASHSGQFRLRLPRSTHAALAKRAEAENVSINSLAAGYIEAGLANERALMALTRRLEQSFGAMVEHARSVMTSMGRAFDADTTTVRGGSVSPSATWTTDAAQVADNQVYRLQH